jgi:hypothetical protein
MNSDEFEQRIDQKIDQKFNEFTQIFSSILDKKLDEKLDKRFDKIEIRLDKIEKRLDIIDKYIKIDALGIENEIAVNFKKHYLKNRRGDVNFIELPFKKLHNFTDGNVITDFDYALIAYNNEYYQIIILEAKHFIKIDKVNDKIKQIYKLYTILKMIKEDNYKDKIHHRLFMNDVEQLKQIIDFSKLDLNILFYIGGPVWEKTIDSYIDYINNYNNKDLDSYSLSDFSSEFSSTLRKTEEKSKEYLNLKNTNINFNKKLKSIELNKDELEIVLQILKGNIGYILPKGDRYKIFDNSITAEQYGGKYKTRFIEFI